MSEEVKCEQSDIDQIIGLQEKYAMTTAQIGQVEVELHLLEQKLEQIHAERTRLFEVYTELRGEEKTLVTTMTDKYGDGVVDLESGKFIPS